MAGQTDAQVISAVQCRLGHGDDSRPFRGWFAAYIADAWQSPLPRYRTGYQTMFGDVDTRDFSAPRQTRAIAATVSDGYPTGGGFPLRASRHRYRRGRR